MLEIKLSGNKLIEECGENLKSIVAKIDSAKMNAPFFLMVRTGTCDYAYCKKDGVYVVPIFFERLEERK